MALRAGEAVADHGPGSCCADPWNIGTHGPPQPPPRRTAASRGRDAGAPPPGPTRSRPRALDAAGDAARLRADRAPGEPPCRTATVLGLALAALRWLPGRPRRRGRGGLAEFRFANIDGGELGFADWAGRPVLVANTASFCSFSPQYAELQALYDDYKDRGLVVLAVPSDDFNQEYATEAEVKDYCELNYDLDLPMTTISHVRGEEALPFYRWLAETQGWEPHWNFNKVLIGADGAVLGTWGSQAAPAGAEILGAIEAALAS